MPEPVKFPDISPTIRSTYGLPPHEETANPKPGSCLRSFLQVWYPAISILIAITLLMGLLLYLLFDPLVQAQYDINRFISQYGSTWFTMILSILLGLLSISFTLTNVRKNSSAWKLELLVIAIEFIIALTVFFFGVMPHYSYLELPGQGLYYFGETIGGTAKGQGRAFDGDKRLIYRGSFDNNTYESQGTLYGTDTEYTGSFNNGELNGYAEESYPKIIPIGRGNIIERPIYKGYYRNGRRHGYGTLYYEDGTVCQEGWFENDEFYGPEPPPDNSGPGYQIIPDD